MLFRVGLSHQTLNSMIQVTQSPLESHQLREIQILLRQGQCNKLKKHIKCKIASHQEAASRLLIQAIEDPRKEAEAKLEAERASHLIKFIDTLTSIENGSFELPITKITIEK